LQIWYKYSNWGWPKEVENPPPHGSWGEKAAGRSSFNPQWRQGRRKIQQTSLEYLNWKRQLQYLSEVPNSFGFYGIDVSYYSYTRDRHKLMVQSRDENVNWGRM